MKKLPMVPKDFPVRPLRPGDKAKDRMTCGECGRSWDDAIPTSYTPAPSARCPFEAYHAEEEPAAPKLLHLPLAPCDHGDGRGIADARGLRIASMRYARGSVSSRVQSEERDAYLDLIVRAANSHNALVAALRDADGAFWEMANDAGDVPEWNKGGRYYRVSHKVKAALTEYDGKAVQS